jgi:hypothetical protein
MEIKIMAQNYEKIVTPVGISQYAWLSTPDTRFDETGHYKTNLILKTEDAAELMQSIDKALALSTKDAQEKSKGKKVKTADAPYFEEMDDDGQETGNTIFKFKCKAQIVTKDGTIIPNRVAMFDASGTPIGKDVSVWSGSEMKVSAELVPYFTSMVGAGVSMRLRAVQITKLVEGGGGNAKGFGFDETDGYVHQETTKTNDMESTTETETSDF